MNDGARVEGILFPASQNRSRMLPNAVQGQHAVGMVESLACCAQYSEDAVAVEQPQSQAAAAAYEEVHLKTTGLSDA